MSRRRLVTGRLFAVAGPLPLDGPQAVVDLREAAVDRFERRLDLGEPGVKPLEARLLLREGLLVRDQFGRLFAVQVGGQPEPQFAELLRDLPVFGRFHRLAADCVELRLDLVDDVGQSRHVLVDAFELAFGVELARFEAADAGRFLENHPPGRDVRLQDLVDTSLLDDAVAGRAGPGSHEQVADVLETGRRAIDRDTRTRRSGEFAARFGLPWWRWAGSRTNCRRSASLRRRLLGLRLEAPLKMTSVISLPRRLLALWSPRIHLMESTTLLLPLPFGPTTPVIPVAKSNRMRSAKLLKPKISSDVNMGGAERRMRGEGRGNR